ncbi:3'-5' exonuclease [Companilactobacillus muriivasis]|uniref:3'-5' exonuclease n=1 Tax=Companilactobacillus muriivasis TaxID=3081444 RepID=UPI0030C6E3E7
MVTYKEKSQAILQDEKISNALDAAGLTYEEKIKLVTRILSVNKSVASSIKKQSYQHLPDSYIVLDLETTGLTNYDEIIQFAALKVQNNQIIDTFDTYVHPTHKRISRNITRLTGIDNELVSSSPTIDDITPNILSFISDYSIVGHNVSFDLRFLRNAGIETDEHTILDTLRLAKQKDLPVANYKLSTLKDYFGVSNRSHNALNDCETTNIVFQNLKNDMKSEN